MLILRAIILEGVVVEHRGDKNTLITLTVTKLAVFKTGLLEITSLQEI